jgi:hypothetical protein
MGPDRLEQPARRVVRELRTGAALDDAGMPPLWPWARAVRDLPAPSAAVASVAAGAVQRRYGSAEDAAAAVFAADTQVVDALAVHAVRQSACLAIVRGDPGELPAGWTNYVDNAPGVQRPRQGRRRGPAPAGPCMCLNS